MKRTATPSISLETDYERSLADAAQGRINEYASADEFFKKMGI